MALANGLAGCADTPPDSEVYLDGEVRRVYVGIDIDVAELLLAKTLGVDGVIAHHPIGSHARLHIPAVIERHATQMEAEGILASTAQKMMLARREPVAHALHTSNYDRAVDGGGDHGRQPGRRAQIDPRDGGLTGPARALARQGRRPGRTLDGSDGRRHQWWRGHLSHVL